MTETPIRPIRQNDLSKAGFAFLAGGRYINPMTREDHTSKTFTGGIISVEGSHPRFLVHGEATTEPLTRNGVRVKVNMIKQSMGWLWEQARDETILVSVERGGKHFYAIRAAFQGGVNLTTYPNSVTEPRLRPLSYGELTFGSQIGTIVLRGRSHPVYETITIGQAQSAA